MNTYAKLRGGWGVRATSPVVAGQTVTVTTKAGQVKTETVSRVLWQGPDRRTGETVYLLAIAPRAGGARAAFHGRPARLSCRGQSSVS
jgi:hypothetical protein